MTHGYNWIQRRRAATRIFSPKRTSIHLRCPNAGGIHFTSANHEEQQHVTSLLTPVTVKHSTSPPLPRHKDRFTTEQMHAVCLHPLQTSTHVTTALATVKHRPATNDLKDPPPQQTAFSASPCNHKHLAFTPLLRYTHQQTRGRWRAIERGGGWTAQQLRTTNCETANTAVKNLMQAQSAPLRHKCWATSFSPSAQSCGWWKRLTF